jgi:ATP-binding cassette, subfamily C (CFTR/MRP), member 1
LSSADLIIALGKEGKVVETGEFKELSNSKGYVGSLIAARQAKEKGEVSTDELAEEIPEASSEVKTAKKAEEPEDKRRQLGDWTVYKYYFSSVGVAFTTFLILFELIYSFFNTFPST